MKNSYFALLILVLVSCHATRTSSSSDPVEYPETDKDKFELQNV